MGLISKLCSGADFSKLYQKYKTKVENWDDDHEKFYIDKLS